MTAKTPPRGEKFAKTAFFLSCVLLAFLYGFLSSHYHWFPAGFLERALAQGDALQTFQGTPHVQMARFDFAGVQSHANGNGDGAPAGSTLITSFWEDRGGAPGLRLIDAAGKTLHHWDSTPKRIWPTSPHHDRLAATIEESFTYVHGSYLFPNGDVLFNVEYMGLVRLDASGNVIWRLDRRTHHSVTRDEHGDFLVCGVNLIENDQQRLGRFPGLALPFTEDTVLRVSPDGEVREEISMLDVVLGSALKEVVANYKRETAEILHLNDVEPLPSAIADQYPTFAAGDLLVSLRDVNTVLVFDPKTKAVKWSASGPFLDQHDPDFIGDGWISVYSNNTVITPNGRHVGDSLLMAFRPHTGEERRLYPKAESPPTERQFYSSLGGKAQLLPNGHWLITESLAGRVFEVDGSGRTIWEWVQQRRADGITISEVMEGTRYPFTEQDVAKWR